MNALSRAETLGLTGTSAEKVAVLRTLTQHDIPVASVRTWLREKGMWFRGADGSMKGTIASVYSAATGASLAALDQFYAAVFGDSASVLRSTDPIWAPVILQTVQMLQTALSLSDAMIDEFYALDGGRPYKSLTVEQFDALAQEKADAAIKQIINARITNASALAVERIVPSDTGTERAAKWAQAWEDAA